VTLIPRPRRNSRSELEEPFVAQRAEGMKNRVGVDAENGGQTACGRETFRRSMSLIQHLSRFSRLSFFVLSGLVRM
jgi:hypothetical protein